MRHQAFLAHKKDLTAASLASFAMYLEVLRTESAWDSVYMTNIQMQQPCSRNAQWCLHPSQSVCLWYTARLRVLNRSKLEHRSTLQQFCSRGSTIGQDEEHEACRSRKDGKAVVSAKFQWSCF